MVVGAGVVFGFVMSRKVRAVIRFDLPVVSIQRLEDGTNENAPHRRLHLYGAQN